MDSSSVMNLPDGTPCYKTYSNSKNQRFWTPEQSSKNRILYERFCKLHSFLVMYGMYIYIRVRAVDRQKCYTVGLKNAHVAKILLA